VTDVNESVSDTHTDSDRVSHCDCEYKLMNDEVDELNAGQC